MPEEAALPDAVDVAKAAAYAGGTVLSSMARSITGLRSKTSATDFVSDVDIAAGVVAARLLAEQDPKASIIVEEPEVYEIVGIEPGSFDDSRVWVIDPLDGTTSYLHTYPCYSVSIALLENGQPTAGAVYNAALDEMNWGSVGAGAFRDAEPIHCTPASTISEALLATGFPYDRGAPLDRQLAVLAAFLRAPVHGIRRDGSAALDCCHVAGARVDGFWEYSLQPWDTAAGVVICREAGARVTGIDGEDWTHASTGIIVANPPLHEAMLELIRSV